MKNFEDFLGFVKNMNNIYEKISLREKELREKGTMPESMVKRKEGCYAIVYRQPDELAETLADFSRAVGKVVPAMVYNEENIQTTITPYALVDNFIGRDDNEAIDTLIEVVKNGLHNSCGCYYHKKIRFGNLLFSRGIILAPGWPNSNSYTILNEILKCCQHYFKPKGPWGSQCVVNRFLEEVPPQDLKGLYELMDKAPKINLEVAPVSIDIVSNTILENGQFRCATYKSFKL